MQMPYASPMFLTRFHTNSVNELRAPRDPVEELRERTS
jgi:hypothetical protein